MNEEMFKMFMTPVSGIGHTSRRPTADNLSCHRIMELSKTWRKSRSIWFVRHIIEVITLTARENNAVLHRTKIYEVEPVRHIIEVNTLVCDYRFQFDNLKRIIPSKRYFRTSFGVKSQAKMKPAFFASHRVSGIED